MNELFSTIRSMEQHGGGRPKRGGVAGAELKRGAMEIENEKGGWKKRRKKKA
jgi:hypothetical protein